jgi:hypothetical protein
MHCFYIAFTLNRLFYKQHIQPLIRNVQKKQKTLSESLLINMMVVTYIIDVMIYVWYETFRYFRTIILHYTAELTINISMFYYTTPLLFDSMDFSNLGWVLKHIYTDSKRQKYW